MANINKETSTGLNNNEIKVITALSKAINSLLNKLEERAILVIDGQAAWFIDLRLVDKSGKKDTSVNQFSRSMTFEAGETVNDVIVSAIYVIGSFLNVIAKISEEYDLDSYEVDVSVRLGSINTDTNKIKIIESASNIECWL